MANVKVEEQSLIDIANEFRKVLGDTYIKYHLELLPVKKISKTSNATGLNTYNGSYKSNQSHYDTISIPGASNIHVKMGYQTENISYDWVQVWSGSSQNTSGTKYGNSSRQIVELDFSGTDTITFYFRSDSSNGNYLGYYAEITGTNASGQPITEEKMVGVETPSIFKPAEMAGVIPTIVQSLVPHSLISEKLRGEYGYADLPCSQNEIFFLVVEGGRYDGWAFYCPSYQKDTFITSASSNIWSLKTMDDGKCRISSTTTSGIGTVYVFYTHK